MDEFDYGQLNMTELAACAAILNPEAHRGLPREVLVAILEGEDCVLPKRTLDKKRLKIMNYINEKWASVRYQVSCPARTQDPHACFSCTDLQVCECTIVNSKHFKADDEHDT